MTELLEPISTGNGGPRLAPPQYGAPGPVPQAQVPVQQQPAQARQFNFTRTLSPVRAPPAQMAPQQQQVPVQQAQ